MTTLNQRIDPRVSCSRMHHCDRYSIVIHRDIDGQQPSRLDAGRL